MTTVALTLREAAARLADAGIEAGDARYLLAFAMDVPRDRLVLMGNDPVPDAVLARFQIALDQRMAHVPVSKIIGQRQFWGRQFRITRDVLDPRPETETLIAAALEGAAPTRLLDLGTGSGCIAITLLAEWPKASGIATDLSAAALEVAKGNAQALGVMDRLTLIRADWFCDVQGRFDLIVSNPPYISDKEMPGLSPEVRDHDPHMALTPGGDGLAPYRVISEQAAAFLTAEGRVLVEIGWKQGPDVAALFRASGWQDVQVLPDMDGRDRVVSAKRD